MPAPHHSSYTGLDALPATQPTASTTDGSVTSFIINDSL